MLIDEYSAKVSRKIEIWDERLIKDSGLKTTAISLYGHYRDTLRISGCHPVSQNLWGQWMGRRYVKGRFHGLTVYKGVGLPGAPAKDDRLKEVDLGKERPEGDPTIPI